MGRHGRRHTAEQCRLQARQATGAEHDGGGVELIGGITDRPPRLPVRDAALRAEPSSASELDAASYVLLGDLVRDLVELQGPGEQPPDRSIEDRRGVGRRPEPDRLTYGDDDCRLGSEQPARGSDGAHSVV
jgi:hypothetical protein